MGTLFIFDLTLLSVKLYMVIWYKVKRKVKSRPYEHQPQILRG